MLVFMVGAQNCEAVQRNEILPADVLMHAGSESHSDKNGGNIYLALKRVLQSSSKDGTIRIA